ncbi:MAG TPA: TonB family protein [Bryobacteraceae bacterium]|nr:TonB family protein [Bryobacteraceae bacterium]
MFDQTFVEGRTRASRPFTFGASLAIQTVVVAAAVVIRIAYPEVLQPKIDTPIFASLRIAKQPPPAVKPTVQRASKTTPRAFVGPLRVPDRIARVVDLNAAEPDVSSVLGANVAIGSPILIPGLSTHAVPDSPPPSTPVVAPKPPAQSAPTQVSAGVQAAKLLFGPKPPYPALAKASRTQGTVKLQAIIAADGAVRDVRVLAGSPLLAMAAVDAVRQWRYQPTLLNGVAVEVLTEIDVIFNLN